MPTNQSKSTKKKPPEDRNAIMRYASMGTQMMVIIGLGVFGGVKLDEYLGWKIPVCTLVLSLLSVSAAIYLSIKDFLKK
ncbi:MAG: AtpZ/AtpI family protein [Bacteroidetes bacterium]|nr:AtpZ/AtpI family protein [Bacteroidota bacterium]MBK8364900.1 AtpZ/AtpI family protein [Bacteroidota bacterium]MBL0030827.1 AtpZ/AtpI family protein [Bacteroidota bacterium]MBP6426241.1 AtpZ/AtpI family protein [Bacteroidia bacterium]